MHLTPWGAARAARAAALIATGVAGCGGGKRGSAASSTPATEASAQSGGTAQGHSPVAPNGQRLSKLSTPGTPKGEQTVSILVVATPGAEKRQTMALVPVFIDGQGPFPFAIDTGASRSLIAAALAQQLHLRDRGSAGSMFGIVGGASAQNVEISSWRAGTVTLPKQIIASLGSAQQVTPKAPGAATPSRATGPVGLLGSDVLSR